ncbi:MAG: tRNA (adenosine(37)-N6)-dimethylallyltransferase MiaA [Candidatus Sungbacteria bacterium]|nr:tRNA (adenosine(37)-N6)-dimethylallyltransferase MiaA [Candidatus Sungbacteria bacterium]
MQQRQKLIVIVGPTATGKSDFAIRLAKQSNCEIISADSQQVYRGLDIGTAKVPGTWKNGVFMYRNIPHHCIDFVSPRKTYSVAEYQTCANAAIQAIAQRGKVPILVGGTGLWIDAVVYGWRFPHVAPDQKLRTRLEQKTAAELLTLLKKLDSRRAKTIEHKNPRRLIRAIEIARALGAVPKLKNRSPYDTLMMGLNPALSVLEKRIRNRTKQIIRYGLISEIKKLLASRISKKRIREFGFEYRVGLAYLDGALSKTGLLDRMTAETRRYAKRQMAWFKRKPNIIWNPSARGVQKQINNFYY